MARLSREEVLNMLDECDDENDYDDIFCDGSDEEFGLDEDLYNDTAGQDDDMVQEVLEIDNNDASNAVIDRDDYDEAAEIVENDEIHSDGDNDSDSENEYPSEETK